MTDHMDEALDLFKRVWNRKDLDAETQIEQVCQALQAAYERGKAEAEKHMLPVSRDGNYVFIDGPGDVELDHGGEMRSRIEALEKEVKDYELHGHLSKHRFSDAVFLPLECFVPRGPDYFAIPLYRKSEAAIRGAKP